MFPWTSKAHAEDHRLLIGLVHITLYHGHIVPRKRKENEGYPSHGKNRIQVHEVKVVGQQR
jgi:hypothetical protein